MLRAALALAAILLAAPASALVAAEPASPREELCAMLDGAADEHAVPRAFFTRLIWTESRFDPAAVSPKGAEGIAQFMPYTAAERGLADPFDPVEALPASARFLRELFDAFGNWGLAAAGYNAGPDRVARWLAGTSHLPFETENFVAAITGRPAIAWSGTVAGADPAAGEDGDHDCVKLVAMLGTGAARSAVPLADWKPWGVQVAGHFSRGKALAEFERVRRRHAALIGDERPLVVPVRNRSRGRRAVQTVRIGFDNRRAAEILCGRLRQRGAACVVLRN